MPISKYNAIDFAPKWISYIYALRKPDDGYIFYVGKTIDLKNRFICHLSDGKKQETSKKGKIIKDLLSSGKKPFISIIEKFDIRTNYDSYYYDYREFYWIRTYLEYGWELTNGRITDTLNSEIQLKQIISKAANGGGLNPSAFYFRMDEKGFPIYDHDKIKSLGYAFEKSQYASHWAYVIDLEKYSNVRQTTMDYIYSDICCEENMNKNFLNY